MGSSPSGLVPGSGNVNEALAYTIKTTKVRGRVRVRVRVRVWVRLRVRVRVRIRVRG